MLQGLVSGNLEGYLNDNTLERLGRLRNVEVSQQHTGTLQRVGFEAPEEAPITTTSSLPNHGLQSSEIKNCGSGRAQSPNAKNGDAEPAVVSNARTDASQW
jgi:hypothetical protein